MREAVDSAHIYNVHVLGKFGLTPMMIAEGINYSHTVLDSLDRQLISAGEDRLGELLELANLSAVIGNLFRRGIARASQGMFTANRPHKYPDLISNDERYGHLEIKVSLETNKPKGHLVKPGPHLTVRYVLCLPDGRYEIGKEKRGPVAAIWEVRVGDLQAAHFSISNTDGDSGKTAVINAKGMEALTVIYGDLPRCPYPQSGRTYRGYLSQKSGFI